MLTQGAEENLLKLKQMRGTLTEADAARWQSICEEYRRRQEAGGDEETGVKVVRQLGLIGEHMQQLAQQLASGLDNRKEKTPDLERPWANCHVPWRLADRGSADGSAQPRCHR